MAAIRLLTILLCSLFLWFQTTSARVHGQTQGGRKISALIAPLPSPDQKQRPPIPVPEFKIKQGLSVMLAVGTGQNMIDKLDKVQTATGRFLKQLDKNVKVGLVLYNQKPYQAIEPSLNRQQTLKAIEEAKANGGNCWQDAAEKAVKMLIEMKPVGPGVVLVITDRSDSGSNTTPAALVKLAKQNDIHIWGVQVGAGGQGLPLRTVLTLDRSRSTWPFRDVIRAGALQYVQQIPAGMGDATVVTFADDILSPLRGQFTDNKNLLNQAIFTGLATKQTYTKIWTALSQASDIIEFARRRSPGLRVRECIVLITDGKAVGEKTGAYKMALAKATDAKIPIHVLLYDEQKKRPQPAKVPKKLGDLCKQTGGTFARIAGPRAIIPVFVKLAQQIRPKFLPLPALREVAHQTDGVYGPVPDPNDLPAGLEWLASEMNMQIRSK